MIGLGALYNAFERETPKWDLAGPPNGRPIRSIIYDKAAPLLSKNCERPKWQRWFYSTILGEECIRIVIDPPHLADMISKRMPFRESAEPYRLLELFIERHKGCLTLERDGEKAIIQEAEPSDIARADGKLVCP